MKYLVILAVFAVASTLSWGMMMTHTDDNGCVRMYHNDTTKGLDAPKEMQTTGHKYDVIHIGDAAYIHGLHLRTDRSGGKCIKGKTFGFDQGTKSIWASGGCKGDFHVNYLIAHCQMDIKLSSTKGGYSEKSLTSPCMDGRSYEMHITSGDGHDCGDGAFAGEHYEGIGNRYGFFGTTVWVSNGCTAVFKVCEIGDTSDKSAPMMVH